MPTSANHTNNSARGFIRLREDVPAHASQAQLSPLQTSRLFFGPTRAKGFEVNVAQVGNGMQMEDLRTVMEGEGVLVQTEVSVTWTTEERIQVLLDL